MIKTQQITYGKIVEVFNRQNWIFAKTMPQNPHHYTLRKKWGKDERLFNSIVQFIRDNGYVQEYKGRDYTCLAINGYFYWTMGAPAEATTLINRKVFEYNNPYDKIANDYDGLFEDDESIQEEIELLKLIEVKGDVLDIGCGSGMLLNHVKPNGYVGIDSSKKMLEIHKAKHGPDNKLVCTSFEHFYTNRKFDTIVCLFGASYINPNSFSKLKGMLKDGGKAYFMFFKPSYEPITHIKTGIEMKIYRKVNSSKCTEFGNYLIWEYQK